MSESLKPVGVIGVGWVGLVTAACFAELGHPVVARDIVQEKVDSLSRGEVPLHEPELEDLLRRNAERVTLTTDMDELLAGAQLLFVCVDTPPTYSGDADLSRVRAVVQELPEDSDHVLIMKSTVPAGTGESIRRDMPSLSYVSCPEFLKEGTAVKDFMNPDRVVVGADAGDEGAADAVEAPYKPLGSLIGKRVALLGLAFKPDTDDMREASSLVLAARLQGEGAEVVGYDPVAAERAASLLGSVEMATSALEALEGADAAVLVTEWPEVAALDWV